jgi:hypothetical protein
MMAKKSDKGRRSILCSARSHGFFEAGTELWEFSPNDRLQKTMEIIMRNFETLSEKK